MQKIKSILLVALLSTAMISQAGVVQNSKGKCGYINDAGELIIDYKYDFIGDFNQYGIAQVKNGNKYGMVNQQGELTVPVKYDEIGFFKDGVATLVSGKKYGLVSEDGRVLTEPQFVEIMSPNSQGVRIAMKKQDKKSSKFGGTSTCTLLNREGKILFDATYGVYISQFTQEGILLPLSKNTSADTINTTSGYFAIQKSNNRMIYDLNGSMLYDNKQRDAILQEMFGPKAKSTNAFSLTQNIETAPYEGILTFAYHNKVKNSNNKVLNVVYGYYDLKNNKLLKYYVSTKTVKMVDSPNSHFMGNMFGDMTRNISESIMLSTSSIVASYLPDENIILNPFSDGFGVVWVNQTGNERTEIINRSGEIVATFPANSCMPYRNGYMVAKNEQGNYGLLDIKQNVVIPYNYKSAHNYVTGEENALFMVLQNMNGNWGAVSVSNQQIVPFEYQNIHSFIDHSVVFVQKNNNWGAYNQRNQILECKYDSLNTYTDEAFLCFKNKNVNVYSVAAQKLSEQVNGCDGVFNADKELHNSTFFRCYNIVNNDTTYGYIDGFADEVLPFIFNEKSKANNAYLIYKDLPTVTFNELEKYRLVLYFSRRERTYQLDGIVPVNDWDY